ncbi:TPA: type VI secretion system-associated protein TagO [Klebsiella oxytoca]|uniref:Type VI secretion system-associated protein TagO n=1 Tax=Klebsiella oxytoca TaxID=571 RepID=A0AAN5L9N1_KLEOX|nr:type VI secretion system-associated protein TagO [Klebsiella oxytoca]
MGLLSLLPLLIPVLTPAGAAEDMSFRQCQQEPDAQVRLACYDALARYQTSPARQKEAEDPDNAWQEETSSGDNMTLQRKVGTGTVFSVACLNQITRVRVRLTQPWEGDVVVAMVDGLPASGNWFVREGGHLLEFGRGLVAINELKRWSGQNELTLRGENGRELRIPLDGLSEAVIPLRHRCQW